VREEQTSTKCLGTLCQIARSNYTEYHDLDGHDDDDDDEDDGNYKDIIMSACPGLEKERDRICVLNYTLICAMK
jgi:hypothetical protein